MPNCLPPGNDLPKGLPSTRGHVEVSVVISHQEAENSLSVILIVDEEIWQLGRLQFSQIGGFIEDTIASASARWAQPKIRVLLDYGGRVEPHHAPPLGVRPHETGVAVPCEPPGVPIPVPHVPPIKGIIAQAFHHVTAVLGPVFAKTSHQSR